MDNTKHTPGPWKQYRDSRGNVRIQGNVAGGPVAFVEEMNNTGGTEQDQANARLIAAAPDLLAALQWAMDNAEWSNDTATGTDPIRAAIAKATT